MGAVMFGFALAILRNLIYVIPFAFVAILLMAAYGIFLGWVLRRKNMAPRYFAISLISSLFLLDFLNGIDYQEIQQMLVLLVGAALSYYLNSPIKRAVLTIVFIGASFYFSGINLNKKSINSSNRNVDEQVFKFVDGGFKHFPEKDGKVKIVELWFVRCPPCRTQLQFIESFKKGYSDNPNVEFLTFNVGNDSSEEIRDLFYELQISSAVGIDSTNYFASVTGFDSYPQLMIIDRNNTLRFTYNGFHQEAVKGFESWLKKSIDELSNEPLD